MLPIIFASALTSFIEYYLGWLLVVLGIGFLIFIHELGHFLVAKYEGVKVETFALGFGRALVSKRWGDTDYRINFIPLGGYVKMKGDLPGEELTGAENEFTSKRPAQRARILLAGVVMNAIFGVIGAILAFEIGSKFVLPSIDVVKGGPAWQAGLKKGDIVLEADGEPISHFQDLYVAVAFSDTTKGISLKVKRGDKIFECQAFPKYDEERGLPLVGVSPIYPTKIHVDLGSSPYKQGLRSGDTIVQVGNKPVMYAEDVSEKILGSKKDKIKLKIKRGKELMTLELKLKKNPSYLLGIRPRQLKINNAQKQKYNGETLLTTTAVKLKIQQGDFIQAINGKRVHNQESLEKTLNNLNKNSKITFTLKRKEKTFEIVLNAKTAKEFYSELSFLPEPVIGGTLKGFPAEKHLLAGDKVLEIDKQKITSWQDIVTAVQGAKEKGKIFIKFSRDGKKQEATIDLKKHEALSIGIGFLPALTVVRSKSVSESIALGWHHSKNMFMQIFLMLKGLFTRQVSSKNLGGPVLIFKASHSQLQLGIGRFIYFLALISVNLAVINLLPIPVLDGGHLLFLAIETIKGEPVSEEVLIWTSYAGLILLFLLIIYVTINDIMRFFP